LAGYEAAISDGVDVLSVSLGSNIPVEFHNSSTSIGSFHAVANNIIVVAAGGNSGPAPSTITNLEPWTLTVAASTIDRDFTSYVILGNKKILKVYCLYISNFLCYFNSLVSLINCLKLSLLGREPFRAWITAS
jgi:hypothetical protein